MNNLNHLLILFDGECNFCSFWVRYVIQKDKKDLFRFASLQSEIGKKYLHHYKIDKPIDAVVLIEYKKAYIKSTASLRILKALGGFSGFLYGLIIIPVSVRDFSYDILAKHRYQWFGKKACELVQNSNYTHKFINDIYKERL